MIKLQNLGFSYRTQPYLQNFSSHFADGMLTVLVGENGAGKSTLLKLITGELKPECGNVMVDGDEISGLNRRMLARRLAYFPQSRPTPDLTASEVVLLGRYPHTGGCLITPPEERVIVENVLAQVGADAFAARNLQTLSQGERQKVYLAMMLAQSAQNYLLDEPTNFLDVSAKFFMLDTLRTLADNGKCVVCVLHDLALALEYADRVVVLKQGAVLADGSPKTLCTDGSLETAFGVRVECRCGAGETLYLVRPKR